MATSFLSQKKEEDQECQDYQMTYKKYNDLIPTLPKEKGWWFEHLFQYQGFWSSDFRIKKVMLIQDHFKFRPTDIVLATYPKSGTTWLRALIFATMNRTSCDFATHPLLTTPPRDLVPLIESNAYPYDSISYFEALPSPRILSTHLPYTSFPDSAKASECKFVYICRNPKDVVVSLTKFTQKLRSKELPPLSLQDASELFCNGVSPFGPFWDHVLSYRKASSQTPAKMLFLRYEDMKREPLVQVKRLAEFLGKPFSGKEESEGVVQEIIKLCSFENLSNLDVNNISTSSQHPINSSYYFRKGEVGDWENHLTPEVTARLDQITKEKLHDLWFSS